MDMATFLSWLMDGMAQNGAMWFVILALSTGMLWLVQYGEQASGV